jgi:hypothetical protein
MLVAAGERCFDGGPFLFFPEHLNKQEPWRVSCEVEAAQN